MNNENHGNRRHRHTTNASNALWFAQFDRLGRTKPSPRIPKVLTLSARTGASCSVALSGSRPGTFLASVLTELPLIATPWPCPAAVREPSWPACWPVAELPLGGTWPVADSMVPLPLRGTMPHAPNHSRTLTNSHQTHPAWLPPVADHLAFSVDYYSCWRWKSGFILY